MINAWQRTEVVRLRLMHAVGCFELVWVAKSRQRKSYLKTSKAFLYSSFASLNLLWFLCSVFLLFLDFYLRISCRNCVFGPLGRRGAVTCKRPPTPYETNFAMLAVFYLRVMSLILCISMDGLFLKFLSFPRVATQSFESSLFPRDSRKCA